MASCANCGANLAKNARYCPQCGNATFAGETKVMDVPADETGPVPVEYSRAETHYYGVTPTTLVLILAASALVLAIVLFALGHWPFGLIALGVCLLLVLVFLEAARRRPDSSIDAFRARAGAAADSVTTRSRAAKQVLSLRREVQRLETRRNQLLSELGAAVYREDPQGTETAREQLRELDELTAEREAEMQDIVMQAQHRLDQRRLEIQPTEMVEIPEQPAPPDEGSPTGPVVIPEPYPPPDEGNPPEPAIIPEPGPLAPEEASKEGRRGA